MLEVKCPCCNSEEVKWITEITYETGAYVDEFYCCDCEEYFLYKKLKIN